MTFKDIALQCAARGWAVLPLTPRDKMPLGGLVPHGFKDATTDGATIRRWWTAKPDANVGIACGASGVTVLDIDNGFQTHADAVVWITRNSIPETYAVRTGRRFSKEGAPQYGVQLYFAGTMGDVGTFHLDGCSGQVKSLGGLVMAEGNVHPDTGLAYERAWGDPDALAPLPDSARALKSETKRQPGEPFRKVREGDGRHDALMREACSMRARGLDADTIYAGMLGLNPAMCEVPISDDDLRTMCDGIERRYPAGEPEPTIVLSGKVVGANAPEQPKEPVDWRTHYHTNEQLFNAPPPTFLIEDFLQRESITAIAAPVGQRKSIIALNVAHALCTKDPLFGHFAVTDDDISRVLYLCPEMGLTSFGNRVKKIGLGPYNNKTFFFRTMNPVNPDDADDGEMQLDDLMPEEVDNAVVIIDTAVRFIEGDENSSADMRVFAKSIFSLVKMKAAAIVVLFHSGKGTKDTGELTLENVMRGSGELGAFVTCCWGTRLQDPNDEYRSNSFLRNCKPRDFDTKPFEVKGNEPYKDFRLHFVPNDGDAVLVHRQCGQKADADGKDAARKAIIRGNPHATIDSLMQLLADAEMGRSESWVKKQRKIIRSAGSETGVTRRVAVVPK